MINIIKTHRYKIILFIASIVFILLHTGNSLLKPGFIYYTDITEPLEATRVWQRYLYTYSDALGESLVEKARIPLVALIYSVYSISSFLLGLDDTYYLKIKLIFTFIFAFTAFTTSIYKLFRFLDKQGNTDSQFAFALIGGIYYAFSFWASNRLLHFSLFYTSAILPIYFYLLYTFLFSKSADYKKLIYLTFWTAVFTATPHSLIFQGIIFLTLLGVYIFSRHADKTVFIKKIKYLGLFCLNTILINSYWLLPYLGSFSTPDKALSTNIIEIFSRHGSILNTIKLTTFWLYEIDYYDVFNNLLLTNFSAILPFLISTTVLIVLTRNKTNTKLAWALIIMLVAGILFTSNSWLSNKLYFWLIFDSPFKTFGWLLREYEKMGLLISFVYAISIATALYLAYRLKHQSVGTVLFSLLAVLVALVILQNLEYSKKRIGDYEPDNILLDFSLVNNYIESDPEEFNTLWYPGAPKPTWTRQNVEEEFVFANLISPKSNIVLNSQLRNFSNFLFADENLQLIDLGSSLDLVGVKYLVLRGDDETNKDRIPHIKEKLLEQQNLELVLDTHFLSVYRNKLYSGITRVYDTRLVTNTGLESLYVYNFNQNTYPTTFIDFTDKSTFTDKEIRTIFLQNQTQAAFESALNAYNHEFIYPYNYLSTKYEAIPGQWGLGSVENKTHAETDFFFKNRGIYIQQFDHNVGIAIADEGWEIDGPFPKQAQEINIGFTKHPNIIRSKNNLSYSSIPDDFRFFWNIIESDNFNVENIDALGLEFTKDIDPSLEPHLKLRFFDRENNLINEHTVRPIYEKENHIRAITKVPQDADFAKLSIWTLSREDRPYNYTIKEFKASDLSIYVQDPAIKIKSTKKCSNTCHVYARLLTSNKGGEVSIRVGEFSKSVDTFSANSKGNFTWVYLGPVTLTRNQSKPEILISNINGTNAISAIAILSDEERNNVTSTAAYLLEKQGTENTRAQGQDEYQISVQRLNPTKYVLNNKQDLENAVISLALPYNKGWRLNNKEPNLINGYVNGWYVDKLPQGVYEINFILQSYFYLGIILTTATTMVNLLVLAKKNSTESQTK